MSKLYMGFDAGTQSVKVAVYDEQFNCLTSHSLPTHLHYPQPGWVEMSADEFLEITVKSMAACAQSLREMGRDPKDVCAVMGVPDEAEQLLLHLISNALRACDAGGRVWVSLKQKKTGVALRVEDNGCGLMEEDPIENNRRFLSGAKLGLRICKLICRRAGWKLTLTARPGGGTRAQVVFPLASCEDIPPEMELHSDEENDIRAARFASRAAQEILLLRRY